ncbi:hypothetical protein B1748_36125, partial [Paenibacillus sp. MY03]|uniref:hypothetical protein n=1 Tax=Paenibacillus sp. MY03 TaxID=302980 RepID=UPI000B568475
SAIEVLQPKYAIASAVQTTQGKLRVIMFTQDEQDAIQAASPLFKLHATVKEDAAPRETIVTLEQFEASLFDAAIEIDTSSASYSFAVRLADNGALETAIANARLLHSQATEGT